MITFSDNIARKPYLGSTEIAEVWLGNTLIYPDTPPVPIDYSSKYFTIEPLENGTTVKFTESGLSYSLDDGSTWTSLAANEYTPSLNSGQKILFKGQLTPHPQRNYGIGNFISNDKTYNVEGNPMSLLFGDNFIGEYDLTGFDYAFYALFTAQKIVNAQNLALVAITLTTACYSDMFNFCANLVTTPTLPATTLADYCYAAMFYHCTSLTTAPALPATTLAEQCYRDMFNGCTSLNSMTCLATNISATDCTYKWVENVAASGTFTKNITMSSWTTGNDGIPNGWTVEDWVDDSKLVITTYEVIDTSSPTELLSDTTSFSKVWIDGVQQQSVTTTYQFSTTGEHTVKYYPSGTSIGQDAFRYCSSLTSVIIPDTITDIDNNAFDACAGIIYLTIPNGVTSIGESAFQSCAGIIYLTIPYSVTSIGNRAFMYCSGILDMTVLATTPPSIAPYSLSQTSCLFYVPAESVNAYKTATNWSRYASRISAIPQ